MMLLLEMPDLTKFILFGLFIVLDFAFIYYVRKLISRK
jgi:hypothetical protein